MKLPPLWDAHRKGRTGNVRSNWIDVPSESVILRDSFGMIAFPLSDLPGNVLKWAMLYGIQSYLRREADPRTVWLSWKNGLQPTHRTKKPKPEKNPRPLSLGRQAIVNAIRQLDGCEASIEQTEALVRGLTTKQMGLWSREPDVVMQRRLLRGDKPLQLSSLVDAIKSSAAQP